MGCDIHCYAEIKKNNKWEEVDFGYEIYDGRNYFLFSVLAGVRNKYKIRPIKEPRGLPDDVCNSIKKGSEDWGIDGHSHSWYTLKELCDFNWNKKNQFTGVVDMNEFLTYLKKGSPSRWSEATAGADLEIMTPEEMHSMIEADYPFHTDKCKSRWRTVVTWEIKYKNYCDCFVNTTIKKLKTLGKPENVRIVFWFDN